MNDGSKRCKLVGGKHDARGKRKKTGGMWLRLYPEVRAQGYFVDKSFVVTTPAVWADEVEYDGDVYVLDGGELKFRRRVGQESLSEMKG